MTITEMSDMSLLINLMMSFNHVPDEGWRLFEELEVEDPSRHQHIKDQLIRMNVLVGCSYNRCDAVALAPFVCICDEERPDFVADNPDDEDVTTLEVYRLARDTFGDPELAKEIASLCPGDLI